MMRSLEDVLVKLRAHKEGVTYDSFRRGKELRKRISELRAMGFNIITEMERVSASCRRARYILMGDK